MIYMRKLQLTPMRYHLRSHNSEVSTLWASASGASLTLAASTALNCGLVREALLGTVTDGTAHEFPQKSEVHVPT